MIQRNAFSSRGRTTCLALALSTLIVSTLPAAEIPKGTHALLRMENFITTKTARAGDRVYLRTASPIVVSDTIIVPVNSYVQGEVTNARRGGRVSGNAELGLRLDTLTLPGGKTLSFFSTPSSVDSEGSGQNVDRREGAIRQSSERASDAGRVLIWAGRGAALGAIVDHGARGAGIGGASGGAVGLAAVILTRGRDVELRRGATLDVVFDRPLIVE